jgi:hypothetical protein
MMVFKRGMGKFRREERNCDRSSIRFAQWPKLPKLLKTPEANKTAERDSDLSIIPRITRFADKNQRETRRTRKAGKALELGESGTLGNLEAKGYSTS